MFTKRLIALILTLLLMTTSAFAIGGKTADAAYADAIKLLQENKYTEAAEAFKAIGNYSDAPQLSMYCYAIANAEAGLYNTAITNLQTLGSFRDAVLLVQYYTGRYYEDNLQFESAQEIFSGMTLYRDVAERLSTYPEKINARDYAAADSAEQNNRLETALKGFRALGSYMDSAARADAVQEKIYARDYAAADSAEQKGQLEEALKGFRALGSYLDSAARAQSVQEKIKEQKAAAEEAVRSAAYAAADAAEQEGKLEDALKGFKDLGTYLDSAARAEAVQVKINERDAAADEAARAAAYAAADAAEQKEDYITAYKGFTQLGNYQDSTARAAAIENQAYYTQAMQYALSGDYKSAYLIFVSLAEKGYSDSEQKAYVLSIITFVKLEDRKNGVATFKFQDKYGLININTNRVLTPVWDSIDTFNSLGLARVEQDGKYGYINTSGRTIIPCEWYAVSNFSEDGICTVAKEVDGQYYYFGLYDRNGKEISPANWIELGSSKNSTWGKSYNSAEINVPSFTDKMIKVRNDKGLYGFIDTKGQIIGEIRWETIGDYSEGFAVVIENNKYGYIDKNGKAVITPQYDYARAFSEKLAAVLNGTLWQFIDQNNNVVIPAKYSRVTPFSDGTAWVDLPGTGWQVIDKTGAVLYFMDIGRAVEDYSLAIDLIAKEDYYGALELLQPISGYKDASELIDLCAEMTIGKEALEARMEFEKILSTGKIVGSYVTFGTYPQTAEGNDNTPIEWLILDYDSKTNSVLLISRYILDSQQYNIEKLNITWESCSLRTWLNDTFYNKAFSTAEQTMIISTAVINDKTQGFYSSTNGGPNTQDKVFLLSYAEALNCFDDFKDCAPTDYVIQQGLKLNNQKTKDGKPTCNWWLRSPAQSQKGALNADIYGIRNGYYVNIISGIRPVLWVSLTIDESTKLLRAVPEEAFKAEETATSTPTPTATPKPTGTPKPTALPKLTLSVSSQHGQNKLSWNSINGATYTVQRRRTNGTDWTTLTTTKASSYTDKEVSSNYSYYYKVFATVSDGRKTYSDEVFITTK